ncbi:MAG TPA: alpha/beta hydrolase [Candidatus Krumholzibacterium sp.]|nr:alpha/beta hydrolase [Candidatus Krumholzibacterium sp.]
MMIDIGKTRLECDSFGEENAPLSVLIPGAGAPAEFWPEPFCRRLAGSGMRVVRYSHRDTGLSTHFTRQYAIDELLQDLTGLIVALGSHAAHLVGHSMGGYLAQIK